MNFLGFGQSAEIDIIFDCGDTRKSAEVKTEDGKKEKYLLFYDGETVSGKVNVTLKKPGSKLEHQGIKIELIGQIELFYDRGNHHEFTSLVRELARPGDLIQNTSYPFEFPNVEKPFEVYVGSNVRLRYFLRATIVRRLSDIVREIDIAVHTLCSYPDLNIPIKMEVGIEDCLHIEFEYNKSKYHLKDVIVGKIYFLLVRIKIKHMEVAIIKRETTGSGPNMYTENETIAKYEIMDGAPVKGESIPIRVFLAGYDLTPTMRDINKKFSVRYFLNLVLMDTEDRRYFKQQEITLWRKADKPRKSQSQLQSSNPNAPTHLVGGPESDLTNRALLGGPRLDSFSGMMGTSTEQQSTGPDGDPAMAGGSNDRQTTDPRMGLFTRESPSSQQAIGENLVSKIPTSASSLPLPISSSTEMQRGTADGAASITVQSDVPSDESAGSGSLFESPSATIATVVVATTPPPLPLATGDQDNDQSTAATAAAATEETVVPPPSQTSKSADVSTATVAEAKQQKAKAEKSQSKVAATPLTTSD